MSHNCPECDELCYCDTEEDFNEARSKDCKHPMTRLCQELNDEIDFAKVEVPRHYVD